MSDDGYFGPDSMTWRVIGEPTSLVGGLRALLLQALRPDAMLLLADKSDFRDRPWDRLRRTADYVGLVTFASRPEVDRAAARVRKIHSMLGIDDPSQLAWVHACEVDSFLLAARRSGLRLDDADADRFVAEQQIGAQLVGVPDDLIPHSTADLAVYFAEQRPGLRRTPEAMSAARYVIAPPLRRSVALFTPARLGWSTVAALGIGLLPRWARRMYRLPGLPTTDLTTTAGLRALRTAVNALPENVRRGPHYREALARTA